MARQPDFIPYQQGERWVVNVPPTMTADGTRRRKTFPNPTAADKFASKLRATFGSGLRGAIIPATLALQAAEAARILDGTGVSLLEAAKAAADRAKAGGPAETFKARLDRAVAANEGNWSEVYRRDVENLWRHLPPWFMQMDCRQIEAATIESAITEDRNLARSSIDHRARYVRAVLGFRERHSKGDTLDLMTPEQVQGLLDACETPEETRCVAVLLFAGIRPSADNGEIMRLDWEDFDGEHIHVRQDASKTGVDRLIPITPRLRRHIAGHPDSGPVAPNNWRRRWRHIRRAAGVTNLPDCTRHAFASHALVLWGEDRAKAAMGHTAQSRTLFRHYLRAVTPDQAAAYFA